MRFLTLFLALMSPFVSTTLLTATPLDKELVGAVEKVRMGKRRLFKTTSDVTHGVDALMHSFFDDGDIEDNLWDASDLSMSMSMSMSFSMPFDMSFSMSMEYGAFDFRMTNFESVISDLNLAHSDLPNAITAGGPTSTDSKLMTESFQSNSSAMKMPTSVIALIMAVAASIAGVLL